MGANFSSKDTKITKRATLPRNKSCEILENSKQKPKLIPTSRSYNQFPFPEGALLTHSSISSDSCDSNGHSCSDITENRFILKVQSYLLSIERLGEISDLKFFFGHLIINTDDGKYSVAVRDESMGEDPIVTLEPEADMNDIVFLYTYKTTAVGLAQKYNYFSFLYIRDVFRSKSKQYILQAQMNTPFGTPTFTPRKIRVPDNPKLVSPYSRFIGTMVPEETIRTVVLYLSKSMEAFYVVQSDLSLAFSTNEEKAGVFTLMPAV